MGYSSPTFPPNPSKLDGKVKISPTLMLLAPRNFQSDCCLYYIIELYLYTRTNETFQNMRDS